MKRGTKLKALHYGCVYTRHNVMVKIKPDDIVIKIKDSLQDKIKFRNMFRIEATGEEVNIDSNVIHAVFVVKED